MKLQDACRKIRSKHYNFNNSLVIYFKNCLFKNFKCSHKDKTKTFIKITILNDFEDFKIKQHRLKVSKYLPQEIRLKLGW